MAIKKDFKIEKRNVLNEIRSNNMTLQELRFFSIYLSKINSRDISTRKVRFTINEFAKIMNFETRGTTGLSYMKHVTNSILSRVVNVPAETGGYTGFQLFKKCVVTRDRIDDGVWGEWYIEINAHDEALPLMFDFKREYFSYELWNALRLKSSNQLRMYEILKQYESPGERIIAVTELKELLGISKKEYPNFHDLKRNVLDVCQAALEEHTDLKYTYETYGRRGPGGKILTLKFTISKNANYTDQLTLAEFLQSSSPNYTDVDDKNDNSVISERDQSNPYVQLIELLMGACNDEFTYEQIELLNGYIGTKTNEEIVFKRDKTDLEKFHYLANLYHEMNTRPNVTHRFNYLKKMVSKA
jgi:plasmid replication initiation protein